MVVQTKLFADAAAQAGAAQNNTPVEFLFG